MIDKFILHLLEQALWGILAIVGLILCASLGLIGLVICLGIVGMALYNFCFAYLPINYWHEFILLGIMFMPPFLLIIIVAAGLDELIKWIRKEWKDFNKFYPQIEEYKNRIK